MDIMHLVALFSDVITGLLRTLTENTNPPDMVDTPLIFVGGILKGIIRGIQKGLKKLTLGKVLSVAVPLIATGGLGALGKLSLGAIAKSAVKNALPNILTTAVAKGKKFGLQDVIGALGEGAKAGVMGHIDRATAGRFGQMMGLTQGLQSGNPLEMMASLQGMGDMMRGGQQPMGGFAPTQNPEAQPRTSATGEMLYADPEEQAQFAQNRVAVYPSVNLPDMSGLPIQQRTSATGEMLYADPEEQMRFAQRRQRRRGRSQPIGGVATSQPDWAEILLGGRR